MLLQNEGAEGGQELWEPAEAGEGPLLQVLEGA